MAAAPSVDQRFFHAWKLGLRADEGNLPTSKRLSDFFQGAAKLVSSEIGIQQEILQLLASSKGLDRIRHLVDQKYKFGEKPLPSHKIFPDQLLPLFNIISNAEVLMSAVLEQYVSTLFTFLYGISGRRAETILQWSSEAITSQHNSEPESEELDAAIHVTMVVVTKILDCNRNAQLDTNLHDPIIAIGEVLMERASGANCSHHAHKATAILERIIIRLDLGLEMPSQLKSTKTTELEQAIYKIPVEPPGGRHDNDHADFREINVLPTPGEILSPHTEYLPVKDLRQNHVQGLEGLLDRSFRLLREDTIGLLRDAVQVVIQNLATGTSISRQQNGTRVYAYYNVRLLPCPAAFKYYSCSPLMSRLGQDSITYL